MPAPAKGVSRPSRHRQYHADDEQDDAEHQQKMSEGERGDEAGKEESQNDEDDSEDDHDVLPDFCVVNVSEDECPKHGEGVFPFARIVLA